MATIKIDIVTAERSVFSEEVDIVIAPGIDGELGILPRHTPLMTALKPGEIITRKGTDEYSLVVSGGFLEVRPERVIILADSAERAEEIDISRAEEAKRRAEQRMTEKYEPGFDAARVEATLQRALARMKVAERHRKRRRRV